MYEYKRAVKIVDRYKPQATIKFIDCPNLSIQKWNKYKGHKKPEKYKDEDLSVTKQITYLNKKIWALNRQLGTSSVTISQFYFRTRKEPHRPARRSVQIALNNKDGVHPRKLISLTITQKLLLDSYKECYIRIPDNTVLQILVEEEELESLIQ